jgi:hypothetical protein
VAAGADSGGGCGGRVDHEPSHHPGAGIWGAQAVPAQSLGGDP